jgi:hypothetical protein
MLNPDERAELAHLRRNQAVIQTRATVHFGELIDALNVRIQQAQAGDPVARQEVKQLADLLDRLPAAAAGLSVGQPVMLRRQ